MEAKKSKFKFSNPVIKSSYFVVNEKFDKEKYSGLEIYCEREIKNQDQQKAQMDLKITVGKRTDEDPFFIELVMSAWFQWESDLQASIDDLLKTNDVALLISYARPHIAYLTSNAGFKAYHLPYINVLESLE